ncbi:hypothetical protein CROQUDRAFT_664762 [Cronartium quercuum f. sp. fusiforme G11]|uniref:Uncharacterized protein n=1 Tax=Cronartium quercuum f. sp. fusiforme G11 TaxID=708437 RepID=A0A9P6T7S3_9BASI|nr:hypothetical protein CROQUDRAFT_664762 [Cronartium quercuum f. sp. fusiforme G11]
MTNLNLLRKHPPFFVSFPIACAPNITSKVKIMYRFIWKTLNNLFKTQALHFNCSPHKTNFKSVSLQPSFVFANFS